MEYPEIEYGEIENIDLEDIDLEDIDLEDIDLEDLNDEENDRGIVRAPRRYIRDGQDPFDFYNEFEFKRRFRFSKESVKYGILPLIQAPLEKVNNRGLPIPPVMQIIICLRFYATASFQLVVGDIVTVSQPTVSRIVYRVSVLLASLLDLYIKVPSTQEARNENRRLFKLLGHGRNGAIGLPGIDGAIDCTHIRLTHTRFQDMNEVFRNRKGYFSLNVQTVVGPRHEFLDIVPEWPGSEHDSRIFQNSRIHMRYRTGQLDGTLVGDAGYPCLPFLLTPLRNPVTDEEIMYNNIQSRTRMVVERTYGIWKRRFPCLSRGLTTKLICSTSIVVACAVLHNLSLIYNDVLEENDEPDIEEEVPVNLPQWQPMDGFAARRLVIERMFQGRLG